MPNLTVARAHNRRIILTAILVAMVLTVTTAIAYWLSTKGGG